MKILLVESNLAAFLSAVYYAYYESSPDLITSNCAIISLLDNVIEISADLVKARKVRKGITEKAGYAAYKEISDAYLSCDPAKEQKIYQYLQLLFKHGKAVFSMHHITEVIAFNDLIKKVRHEAHRMQGFLRFQEMSNGIFYCYFGTDNDILELILPHFTSRFNCQQFVLHDIKRKKLAYYDGAQCHLLPAEEVTITLSDKEVLISGLWKEYFNNVAISDRANSRLQTQFLPKKYRWFMNEF
ncbi:MAG: DNA metabolism protein [Clostridia bacterium]|nr:DNA metabolism protein [Clostridia bacterium]